MESKVDLFQSQMDCEMAERKRAAAEKAKNKPAVQQWDNPIEFLMTCIGYAVGIGGVIRFPYLCFKNGGCAYVIAFLIMLFFFGVPLFFLELTISQYSKCGADKVWKVIPLLKGLGVCSVVINTYFCIYFNVLISYSVIYLTHSFYPVIPWTTCDNWWNSVNCITTEMKANSTYMQSINGTKVVTAAKEFFVDYVLQLSDGIETPGGLNYRVVAALAFCWALAFLILLKGIKYLGKVSYFTAIFPYVMISVLIAKGLTLEGAYEGLKFYILTVDVSKLLKLGTWIDASAQALFCLGIAQGSLFTLGKHNSFHYNHQKATFFIALLDGFTGVYAGFALFPILGYLAHSTGTTVEQLELGGLGLSFIAFPEALTLMPLPWLWCALFFMMMITIGFGSLLSMAECCLDTFQSITGIDRKHTTKLRFCTILFFFLAGLSMTTRGGYYLLNLIDDVTCTLPIIFLATLEAVGLGWFYGIRRISDNLRLMLNTHLKLYWKICFAVVTPSIAIMVLLVTIMTKQPVMYEKYVYPDWCHYLGTFIVCTCLAPLFIFMFKEMSDAGVFDILKTLTQPGDNWKPAFDDDSSESGSSAHSRNSLEKGECYEQENFELENTVKV